MGSQCVCLSILSRQSVLVELYDRIRGDLNGDGRVTSEDVKLAFELFLNRRPPTRAEWEACDVLPRPGTEERPRGDGRIGAEDINWIMRRSLNLEPNRVRKRQPIS
jgi:hypothetical protein